MANNQDNYLQITASLQAYGVTLVAVSKTKPVEDILALYKLGQRDFGENYVQELVEKARQLPPDIRWHFIGHLQTNKVKLIAPFVQLIHGVDSLKLLKEINKEAGKTNRVVDCLLQCFIAQEETKFGLDEEELHLLVEELDKLKMPGVRVVGLMGMGSFTEDMNKVRSEFRKLKELFNKYSKDQTSNFQLQTLSMGMSSDYKTAIEEGSTMIRIGSLLFGERANRQ
ncbi:MAG: YggS family pyridoxal phosphate-dependent enzyme [Bacteroidota bacterium]|nr:YggS family pyridoxal phosphate-dependent enzyme [Bacteroidota bacterium]